MLTKLKGLLDFFSLLRKLFDWFRDEQQKQIGRNEAAYDVTRKTAETENRMRDIERPSDDDVARSMQERKF